KRRSAAALPQTTRPSWSTTSTASGSASATSTPAGVCVLTRSRPSMLTGPPSAGRRPTLTCLGRPAHRVGGPAPPTILRRAAPPPPPPPVHVPDRPRDRRGRWARRRGRPTARAQGLVG